MLNKLMPFQNGKKLMFEKKRKLGDEARDARAWDNAVAHYSEALQINPNAEGIWVQLGHAQKELGMFGKAEESYLRAIKLNPHNADTSVQLGHLFSIRGDARNALKRYRQAAQYGSRDPIALECIEKNQSDDEPESAIALSRKPQIYFDYSDLVQYFRHNRFPTGIQRVQIELFKAAQETASDVPLRACAFLEGTNFWAEIDPIAFRRICDLSSLPGDIDDPTWITALSQLTSQLEKSPSIRFPKDSILVNIGTSWWIRDYGAFVRQAKLKFGLRYVPFIHDLIPLLTPEHCSKGLVEEFRAWINLVTLQADFIAVNSSSTRNDVLTYAKQESPLSFDPVVVRLDAEFARNKLVREDDHVFLDNGLEQDNYVLFVGTLESRKNHVGVFQAWKKLIAKHGVDAVPTLVCVGKRGWLFDQANALLEADATLANKVVLLSGISDDDLASLYKRCLFTVYASFYEGWGLPVTESLSFGKACLTANNSSLPEAGSRFADYYDNASVPELVAGLEKLLFDKAYRERREAEIATDFATRRWEEVLHDLIDGVTGHFSANSHESQRDVMAEVKPGVLYDFRTRASTTSGIERAIADTMRHDLTWHAVETWGAWARSKSAKLAFKLLPDSEPAQDELLVYLKLCCGPMSTEVRIRLAHHTIGVVDLAPHETRFVRFPVRRTWLAEQVASMGHVVLVFDHRAMTHLAEYTDNRDRRSIGVGFCAFGICHSNDFAFRLNIQEHQYMQVL
ncbi:glycosyltransferase [Paraburkholderia sp. DGU8]|uniref:glycosyltransferase n=1 Tax=Paraburkholderia sp. DGU8 TaxID=3161997 RepID=UPI0034673C6A